MARYLGRAGLVPGTEEASGSEANFSITLHHRPDLPTLSVDQQHEERDLALLTAQPMRHIPPSTDTDAVARVLGWFRRPGWPVALLFVGFPLWWILGVQEVVMVAIAIPMGVNLIKHPRVAWPSHFACWLLFLLWVVAGVFVLQANAPGAVPGVSHARYLTWAYRLSLYVSATVALLYVGNNRDHLPAQRIYRILSWMFIFVVAGGLAGTFFPDVQLKSALELVLPRAIATQEFVHAQIHPNLAQVMTVLGHEAPRPSAPFTYTNTWGLAYLVLVPFFIKAWTGRDSEWRRFLAPVILALSAIPVIYSANRGMWLGLLVLGAFLAIRSALTGRPAILIAMVLALGIGGVGIALSPLGNVVQQRLTGDAHNSNQARTNLASLTMTSMLEKSPIVGYGTTRQVQGNFNTIAGGSSAICDHCSPPSLGTQGQLWLILFTQGVIGAGFYITFIGLSFLRNVRSRSPSTTTALCVILAGFVTMPFYNSLGMGLLVIFIAIALVWRENRAPVARSRPVVTSLSRYRRSSLFRRHVGVLAICSLVGIGGGATWQLVSGTPTKATVDIWVPNESGSVSATQGNLTMDTLAQLAKSGTVIEATRQVSNSEAADAGISVTATPNSRILHLSVEVASHDRARTAAMTAVRAFDAARENLLTARRQEADDSLTSRAAALQQGIRSDERSNRQLRASSSAPPRVATALLRKHESSLSRELSRVQRDLLDLRAQPAISNVHVRPPIIKRDTGAWNVALTSGLALGLLVGLLCARRVSYLGGSLRRSADVARVTGTNVVARIQVQERHSVLDADALTTVKAFAPTSCLVADLSDGVARRLANDLDEAVCGTPDHHIPFMDARTLIVVSEHTKHRAFDQLTDRLHHTGAQVVGVVIAESGCEARSGAAHLSSDP